MAEEKKPNENTDFTDGKWHPAEIRREDILKLLDNTKKLATMYNDLMEIKKEGWERMLEGQRKSEERKKAKNG